MIADQKASHPSYVCPRCRGPLAKEEPGYRCLTCSATYPIVLGIPDFRVLADPWISMEDDRAKAAKLMQRTEGRDFAATVREYWKMTPGTPADLAERYTQHVLAAEPRVAAWLTSIGQDGALGGGVWLDIGCGTADLIAAARRRGQLAVGVDIALRWLIVARRRLDELQLSAPLVCADGEHLPFADDTFERVFSLGTLEHCQRAANVIAEARRVSAPRGVVRVRTVNRYSLLPEPHVRVWGVGFVPRAWADRYVRWRSGLRYLHHRPLSPRELASAMRDSGLRDVDVQPALLLNEERDRIPRRLQWAARIYDRIRTAPLGSTMLSWVAPLLEARGVAA